jgi:hypothetical protein
MTALEFVPILPIPFLAMPTLGACPAGVAWIDRDDRDTFGECLVTDEGSQLIERPSLRAIPLRLPDRCPLADSTEFFDPDGASGALGLGDNRLADLVVLILSEVRFLAADFAEPSLALWVPTF